MMARMAKHGRAKDRDPRPAKRRGNRPGAGWTIDSISESLLGPGVRAASLEEALAALENLQPDLDWAGVSDQVIPLFQRLRPYPPGFPDAVRHVLPSGISVTFGIDTGPAFLHVTPEIIEGWGRTVGQVADRALRNLRQRAALVGPDALLREPIGHVPMQALQSGTGSASTFVLVPDELPRIFGPQRQLFLAPMRDLLVSVPWDIEPAFASWLYGEFAMPDPNCLAPLGFRFADGRVTVEALDEPAAIA